MFKDGGCFLLAGSFYSKRLILESYVVIFSFSQELTVLVRMIFSFLKLEVTY